MSHYCAVVGGKRGCSALLETFLKVFEVLSFNEMIDTRCFASPAPAPAMIAQASDQIRLIGRYLFR